MIEAEENKSSHNKSHIHYIRYRRLYGSRIRRDGEKKKMSLARVDDLAIVANMEEKMTSMLERIKGYVKTKKIALNVRKSMMMVF